MTELLAPAGSWEALKAAVNSGADAVYLAGAKFGARAYAENFAGENMKAAIKYAHLRGVKVHVTVNTVVIDDELEELADYLLMLYNFGADALLLQDMGALHLAKSVVPRMPLHASTQMTATNLAAVNELADLGFVRVVLARELSLKDIVAICQNSPIEIEVFIHGALCVCYSGQCLMSSLIGGRSGNRGRCAQPCRLPYDLTDDENQSLLKNSPAYLLSPKDLNTIDILSELVATGVSSLKIEGRMKRPEYVATVVSTYRQALDRALTSNDYVPTDEEKKALGQIFNRDFTTAYLKTKPGRNLMSYLRPNNRGLLVGRVLSYEPSLHLVRLKLSQALSIGDQIDFWVKVGGRVNMTVTELWNVKGQKIDEGAAGEEVTLNVPAPVHPHDRVFKIYDARLTEKARQTFVGADTRKISLDIEIHAAVGQRLSLIGRDADGNRAEVKTEFIGVPAKNRPLTKTVLRQQMSRLGDTVFTLGELSATLDGEVMFPVSELNRARRQLTSALEEQRLDKGKRSPLSTVVNFATTSAYSLPGKGQIVAAVDTVAKAEAAFKSGADAILFGGDTYDHHLCTSDDYRRVWELGKSLGRSVYWATPRVILPEYLPMLRQYADLWKSWPAAEIYVHSLGGLNLLRQHKFTNLHADYSLIAANSQTLAFWHELGINSVTLSPELNLRQVEMLAQKRPLSLECIVYGRLELMVSRYCAANGFAQNQSVCLQPCRQRQLFLQDRKNVRFPLGFDAFCQMHVLNGKILSMLPYVHRFSTMGIDRLRLELKDCTPREVGSIVQNYVTARQVTDEDALKSCEPPDITRGHYFRGAFGQ